MSPNAIRSVLGWVAVGLLVAGFAIAAYPRTQFGTSEIAALMLGTPDEHLIAQSLHRMFVERTLDYAIPVYGGFYPNLAFLLLKAPLRLSGEVAPEPELIVGLRLFSLAFGLVSLGAIGHLAWLASGRVAPAVLSVAFMAVTPEFLYWSVRIHPDTLLLFLVVLTQSCMVVAVRRRNLPWLFGAFVLSILATMTKLVGLFFLPWLAAIYLWIERPWLDGFTGLRRAGLSGLKAVLWFAVIAYATTPTLLVDSRAFFGGIRAQMATNAAGESHLARPYGWGSVLTDSVLVGPVALACFIVLVGATLVWAISTRRSATQPGSGSTTTEIGRAALILLLFPVGYLGYLLLTTKLYAVRYAMPALPSFALAVGLVGSGAGARLFGPWTTRRGTTVAAFLTVVAAFAIVELGPRRVHMERDFRWLQSRDTDPRLDVGRWLKSHAPHDSTVIYDYGVYVPGVFKDAHKTFGLLARQVQAHRPDYVLLLDHRREQFGCPNARHEEICRSLEALDAGELGKLLPLRRFENSGLTVYASATARARSLSKE